MEMVRLLVEQAVVQQSDLMMRQSQNSMPLLLEQLKKPTGLDDKLALRTWFGILGDEFFTDSASLTGL